MKVIVCELCDNQNFIKEDDLFVCQGCGTKYSLEQAKAMMKEMEEKTPAAAPVTKSSDLERYLLLARRARDSDNSADAAKYYGLVEAEDPNSWEGLFYHTYFTAMQTNVAGISSAAALVTNCLPAVVDLIKNHVSKDQQLAVVEEVVMRCNNIAGMLLSAASNHYFGIDSSIQSNYTAEYRSRMLCAAALPNALGDELDKVFGADPSFHNAIVSAWKKSCATQDISGMVSYTDANSVWLNKIGKYDKDFVRPYKTRKINELKERIAKLEESEEPAGCGGGVICCLFGSIGVFLGFLVGDGFGVFLGIVGLALLIGGIFAAVRPKQKSAERLAQDRTEINALRMQIAELEESIK